MKALKALIASTITAFAMSGPAHGDVILLADTQADFSLSGQGVNGFEYGVYNTAANATTGTFSTAGFVVSGLNWQGGETYATPALWVDGQHPGVLSLYSAVRRYTVGSGAELDYSGLVRIEGTFFDLAGGDTSGFVTVNGVNLFLASVPNTSVPVPFDITVSLSPGSTIDFGVSAAGDGAISDSTGLVATVSTVPEPATVSLLTVGGLLMLRRNRRTV